MQRITRRTPSPSMAVALIALFVALGGVAWAAATIGARDIKDNAVRTEHIKRGQVKTSDLARAAKAAFLSSDVTVRESTTQSVDNGSVSGTTASCNPGEIAVGGGVGWSTTPQPNTTVMLESGPSDTDGWSVTVGNTSGSTRDFRVRAVCVAVG
jgi:hypothetical protein